MPLSANWQILLQDQLMRGIFFMHPQMALGMVKQFSEFAIKEASLEELRADFQLLAMDHNGDEYSVYDEAPQGSVARFLIHGPMLKYGVHCAARGFNSHGRWGCYWTNLLLYWWRSGFLVTVACWLKALFLDWGCCRNCRWGFLSFDCDWIIAKNSLSCEIGSIGVMADFWDIAPYYEIAWFKTP